MSLKNTLLKILFKPSKKEKRPSSRILIVSTTALGDTLWATPAIASLKKSKPDAFLAVLTSPIGYEVLKTNPSIDKLFLFKKSFRLWRLLRKEKFDTVIVFHASQRIVFPLIASIGASIILGSEKMSKGLDELFTDILPLKYEHEITRRLRLIEAINAQIHTEELSFIPDLDAKAPITPHKPYIVLHPGSKDLFKRWPAEHFVFVGKHFQKQGYHILISGNTQETELMRNIADKISHAQMIPPSSLHSFAKILQGAHLLITNDSGPLHLVSALGCKAICIYGPTDPNLCGPHKNKNIQILSAKPTCSPCFKKNCKRPFCLFQISPQEVISKAMLDSLEKQRTP